MEKKPVGFLRYHYISRQTNNTEVKQKTNSRKNSQRKTKDKIKTLPLASSALERYLQSFGVEYSGRSNDIRVLKNAVRVIELYNLNRIKETLVPSLYFNTNSNYSNTLVLKKLCLINALADCGSNIKETILANTKMHCLSLDLLEIVAGFLDLECMMLLKITCRSMYLFMTSNYVIMHMLKRITKKYKPPYYTENYTSYKKAGVIISVESIIDEQKNFPKEEGKQFAFHSKLQSLQEKRRIIARQ
ncbi:putative orfan [Tupanvirus soda lake]|uniref:Orfan n=2 Tax=Tupanvirus TaxID=2094720 RepID=A0AC62AD09_9VIRU|nr:putative orfan [Tupanvirus soda lake]QKU35677.1 putative orfan [Tupanvirus soda lake]